MQVASFDWVGMQKKLGLALGPNYHAPVRWGRKKSTTTRYKVQWYFCSFYIQVQEKKILLLNHMVRPFL